MFVGSVRLPASIAFSCYSAQRNSTFVDVFMGIFENTVVNIFMNTFVGGFMDIFLLLCVSPKRFPTTDFFGV